MSFKKHFKEIGLAYLGAIEGAVGCPIDANYTGKTYLISDLNATLQRFYSEWSTESISVRYGEVIDKNIGGEDKSIGNLNSAASIDNGLREKCRDDPGIFFIMNLKDIEKIRSLLMFADAIFFWDPFEETFSQKNQIDSGVAGLGLSLLAPVRSLIAEGLLIPAQIGMTKSSESEQAEGVEFDSQLMWQGALSPKEFVNRLTDTSEKKYELSVPEGILAAKGYRGHAENKMASLIMPDVVIPVMDYESISKYEEFCKNSDRHLTYRELEYIYQSLPFETGFILDPTKLTNEILLDLRERDSIFCAMRTAILTAIENYEKHIGEDDAAKFIQEFNVEIQSAFRELKEKALVSNTWKEYVDESRSFSTRFLAKSIPNLVNGTVISDMMESLTNSGITSIGNVLAASLKTYSRYRNTKIFMDVAASIRESHSQNDIVRV